MDLSIIALMSDSEMVQFAFDLGAINIRLATKAASVSFERTRGAGDSSAVSTTPDSNVELVESQQSYGSPAASSEVTAITDRLRRLRAQNERP